MLYTMLQCLAQRALINHFRCVFTWFQLSPKAKCWRLTPRHNYALIMYGKYRIYPHIGTHFVQLVLPGNITITSTNLTQWTCRMSIYNIYLVWQHIFTCEHAIFISTTQKSPLMTDTMCLVLKIQLERNCFHFLVSVITAADLRLSVFL